MHASETTYILGSGAVGFPLAVHLASAGRAVIAVRTGRDDVARGAITIGVRNGPDRVSASIETVSLPKLARLDGLVAVTAKSYANEAIASALKSKAINGPIVLMQNGVGVERPFLEAGLAPIFRCILYVTGQRTAEHEFAFHPISDSAVGIVTGTDKELEKVVRSLTTAGFPFCAERSIQRQIWKKAIINSVFNSICPLLDVDNGVFARDKEAARLAEEVTGECLALTERLRIGLTANELMEQAMRISKGSDGQLISTLQDIRNGRETEIEFLNLEIARIAASLQPPIHLHKTELLGRLVREKSAQHRQKDRGNEADRTS